VDAGWRSWLGRDRWVVHVRGELDVESGPRLRDFLAAQLARETLPCVVDLSKVTFIDSSGLHALVASLRRAQLLGRRFTLVLDPSGRVQRLLEMTGLGALFEVVPAPIKQSMIPVPGLPVLTATGSVPASSSAPLPGALGAGARTTAAPAALAGS
jgi:anti-sigma B factor antagonist